MNRVERMEKRLRPGMSVAMWGALAGNLAWEMLRIVGRHGHVWAQEPDPERTRQASDFFVLPNLKWENKQTVCTPTTPAPQMLVIDWVPYGGDILVLRHLESWSPLSSVTWIMTEQNTRQIRNWFRDRGWQLSADSHRWTQWWYRKTG